MKLLGIIILLFMAHFNLIAKVYIRGKLVNESSAQAIYQAINESHEEVMLGGLIGVIDPSKVIIFGDGTRFTCYPSTCYIEAVGEIIPPPMILKNYSNQDPLDSNMDTILSQLPPVTFEIQSDITFWGNLPRYIFEALDVPVLSSINSNGPDQKSVGNLTCFRDNLLPIDDLNAHRCIISDVSIRILCKDKCIWPPWVDGELKK